jgi:hypothetical protein
MAERQGQRWSDAALVDALRAMGPEIAWPTPWPVPGPAAAGRDVATAVRARIESMPSGAAAPASLQPLRALSAPVWFARPAARALLIAAALLIILAAIAGATGIELPGLRILFGTGSGSPPPSLEPSRSPSAEGPGAAMRLGLPVSLSDRATLDAQAGFHVAWPSDPAAGQPDAGYIDEVKGGQVSLVWSARDDLPATLEPGVGLVLTEFRGAVDEAYYSKVVGAGTIVEPVLVSGRRGYWLSGSPHFFFYTGPGGVVQDDRRWVGDALLWSDGDLTYRLESPLGRDATIRIAESLR